MMTKEDRRRVRRIHFMMQDGAGLAIGIDVVAPNAVAVAVAVAATIVLSGM